MSFSCDGVAEAGVEHGAVERAVDQGGVELRTARVGKVDHGIGLLVAGEVFAAHIDAEASEIAGDLRRELRVGFEIGVPRRGAVGQHVVER